MLFTKRLSSAVVAATSRPSTLFTKESFNERTFRLGKAFCTATASLFLIGTVCDIKWLKGEDQILNYIRSYYYRWIPMKMLSNSQLKRLYTWERRRMEYLEEKIAKLNK